MQIFKTTPNGFAKVKKKMLLRAIQLLVIAGAAGLMISSINNKQSKEDVNVLPFVIPMAALALGFGLDRGLKRQKEMYESFTLTVMDNLIKRDQLNTPTIWLYFNDIAAIIKHKNGSFSIKGKTPSDLIMIPADMDNPLQLETTLQSIKAITTKDTTSFLEKYQSLSGLLTVALMVCVYTVSNKWIVGITGSALVALMIWSLVKIQKSKNVDEKTRRSSWIVLIVLASVIGVMFFKLTGLLNAQ